MIASLRGQIDSIDINEVVIDCQGVGYGLRMSGNDISLLQSGKTAHIHIYEHIKDDAHDLYGFLSKDTKRLFVQLLSVKNIGPKAAMALLDVGSVQTVRQAIANGEVKTLQSAKGVGKRAAEQVVVELRDKMGVAVGEQADALAGRGAVRHNDEALLGLIALGFNEADALEVLADIDPSLSTEARITQALKKR